MKYVLAAIGLFLVIFSGINFFSNFSQSDHSHIIASSFEESSFINLTDIHRVKTSPGPQDWLATHPEPGQTFEQYVQNQPVVPDSQRHIIYIMLLGDFNETEKMIIDSTGRFISVFYGMPVRFFDTFPLATIPESAQRVHPQWGGKQVLTTYILDKVLKPKLPKDAISLIAFTSSDLWPGEGWNFVFGQAALKERVGVWSVHRNGDPTLSKNDYQLCLKRTIQTGIHEIGHMISLPHCIYFECVMNGSNHRKESDERPVWFCPVCLRKFQWAMDQDETYKKAVDIEQRFEDLAELSSELGFPVEEQFYRKSLAVLRQFLKVSQ